jgi:hypothetical protein
MQKSCIIIQTLALNKNSGQILRVNVFRNVNLQAMVRGAIGIDRGRSQEDARELI